MRFLWGFEVVHPHHLELPSSVIIASNHISWFDPPLIGAVMPFEISFLAKAELFQNRFFGALIRQYNALPIVRQATDRKGINQALAALQAGKSLLLFPEGTRRGQNIKPGVGMFALQTQKAILPVYIENSDHLRLCFFRRRKIKIVIGELIPLDFFGNWEPHKANYQKLADYTYQKITELKHADHLS